MEGLEVAPGVVVPVEAMTLQAVRASGPGGQNVNKVSSKIQLRVAVDRIVGLSREARERLERLAGSRWIEPGELLITAAETRSQPDNRQIAENKLIALLRRALVPPRPRRKTLPTKGSQERRLDAKRLRSQVKRRRGGGTEDA